MKRKNIFKPIYLVFILAFLLRFTYLSKIPYRVDGDASRGVIDGISALNQKLPFFSTGWQSYPMPIFYIVGLFTTLVSDPILGIRLFSAIGGILGIISFYYFTDRLLGESIAFWSCFFMAVCPFHLVFSRNGLDIIWSTFFISSVFYFLLAKNRRLALLSGFIAGISQYSYFGLRLIPLLVVVIYLLLILSKSITIKNALTYFAFFLFGFLFAYFPMIKYYLNNPNAYIARINIVGILQSGWLHNELQNHSIFQVLIDRLLNSFLVFHFPVPTSPFWFVYTPFLKPLSIFFFSVGLLISLLTIKKLAWQFLYLYFFSGVFLGGLLTVGPPMPSRYIVVFPAVMCFIGLGADTVLKLFKKTRFKKIIPFIFCVLAIYIGIYSYWKHETVDAWRYDQNTQIATYAGRYFYNLNKVNPNYNIYFVGNKNIYYEAIPTLPLLSNKNGIDVFEPISNQLKINKNQENYFIVIPSREMEIFKIQQRFPRASKIAFHNPLGEILFWLVKV